MPTFPGNESSNDVDARQQEPFQFSIRWLLGLTFVVAAVFGLAKWYGFSSFFIILWAVAYFFGPFTIWAAMGLCPTANRRHRKWFGAAAAISLILPPAIVLKDLPVQDRYEFASVFSLGTALLWALQYSFIALHFFIVSLTGPKRETDELPRSVFARDTDDRPNR